MAADRTLGPNRTLGQRVAPARFLAFLAIFAIAYAMSSAALGWTRALMTGFNIAAVFFLVAVTPLLRAHDEAEMRQHAAENDANRFMLLVITGVVMLAVLTAIAAEVGAKTTGSQPKALIIATLTIAWLFSNTIYALHYAHLYYRADDGGGLDFGGEKNEPGPDYGDFVYFAYILGMTFQTSDTNITKPYLRRIVTLHSLAAFVFNIGVLAFSINVLGSG